MPFYVANPNISSFSIGYVKLEVDMETGEVKGLEAHPNLARQLLESGFVTRTPSGLRSNAEPEPEIEPEDEAEGELPDGSDEQEEVV